MAEENKAADLGEQFQDSPGLQDDADAPGGLSAGEQSLGEGEGGLVEEAVQQPLEDADEEPVKGVEPSGLAAQPSQGEQPPGETDEALAEGGEPSGLAAQPTQGDPSGEADQQEGDVDLGQLAVQDAGEGGQEAEGGAGGEASAVLPSADEVEGGEGQGLEEPTPADPDGAAQEGAGGEVFQAEDMVPLEDHEMAFLQQEVNQGELESAGAPYAPLEGAPPNFNDPNAQAMGDPNPDADGVYDQMGGLPSAMDQNAYNINNDQNAAFGVGDANPSAHMPNDPDAPLDRSAPEAADPNAYDPGAYGSADPNAYDPTAYGEADPNAFDPNAYGAADPNAGGAADPNANGADPSAYGAADLNAYDPNAYGAADPDAGGADAYGAGGAGPSQEDANRNVYGDEGNTNGQQGLYESGPPGGYGGADGGYGGKGEDYGSKGGGYESKGEDYGAKGGDYGVKGGDVQGEGGVRSVGALGGVDVEALLSVEREKNAQQLQVETAAREELEDMILRIEKHFKAEQEARKKAEQMLEQAIGTEMDAKNNIEDEVKKSNQEQKLVEEERKAIKRERQALERMRHEFELELEAARSEVGKAQEALTGSEERIKATEEVERARLEAEFQANLASMMLEMDRMREELGYRTFLMNDEMEKWRQQAEITATAVMDAKSEVADRKKELDNTKEKMDRLLDKLSVGRERGIELNGAISNNQRMLSYMGRPPMGMGGGMGAGGGMYGGGAMGGRNGMPAGQGALVGPSNYPIKLPPLIAEPLVMMGPGGGPMIGGGPPPLGQGPPLGPNGYYGDAGMNGMVDNYTGNSTMYGNGGQPGQMDRQGPPHRRQPSPSPQQQEGGSPSPRGDGQYGHVKSKFLQDAEEHVVAAKARSKSSRPSKSKQPDRFEEASRDNSRVAAMAGRWN
eukprot:gene14040-19977_t